MRGAEQVLIDVRGLSAGYGERLIVRDINLQVHRSEVLVILGRSGSGKSTLLNCLIGLKPPLSGEVWIRGQDLARAFGSERQAILRQFGVLYQTGALFGSMTVLENVLVPLNQYTDLPSVAKELIALSKLKLVNLAEAAHRMPAELSGGMQKRAAIARAMALDPPVLFLDEPSVGLDPITSAGLDALIKRLSEYFGITFVIVTHEMASVYAIASRAVVLDDVTKTIIAEGSPTELRDHPPDPLVRRFFHREAPPDAQLQDPAVA